MTSTQRTDDIDRALPQQRHPAAPPPGPPLFDAPTPLTQAPRRPDRRDVLAIQASLAAVRGRPVALGESFYAHLFELAPAARAMFADDISAQMQRMTDVLI